MEKCYIIKYKSIEIGITLKRVEDLRPHEEVDIRHLTGIMHALITLQLIRHPIIVDKHTNVILDGAHRFEALKRIGCKTIPVSLMDYSDERIDYS
jgi:ParB-like nuclease domain.